ncbi:MAG: hypothetical protein JSS65_08580 [Armatimonadetes bacterium]|nr:hypothetical protein [Armatimonadota bacterium]
MSNLVLNSSGLDIGATSSKLLEAFPALESFPLEAVLESVQETLRAVGFGKKKRPQYLWLFLLAGRVKGLIAPSQRNEEAIAMILAPIAAVFAEAAVALGLIGTKSRIDWNDADAVEMEWLQAWASRKLPLGSASLDNAVLAAKGNPLGLQGNRYFIVVVNLGYLLQEQNDPFPFILPVSAKVAALLGTTAPTVGSAVNKAIRDGIFVVENSKYSASTRTARLLRFNKARLGAHVGTNGH